MAGLLQNIAVLLPGDSLTAAFQEEGTKQNRQQVRPRPLSPAMMPVTCRFESHGDTVAFLRCAAAFRAPWPPSLSRRELCLQLLAHGLKQADRFTALKQRQRLPRSCAMQCRACSVCRSLACSSSSRGHERRQTNPDALLPGSAAEQHT